MSHIVTSEDVKADEAKVKTIAGIPAPTDKVGLKQMFA